MESPKSDGNPVDISPSAQKSPFSKYLNNLSPIKSERALLYTQRLSESSLPTTLPVFSSPHLDLHRQTSFLKREDVAASSSNANGPILPSCFNASEVTTGKVDDTNDGGVEVGAQALPHLANKQLPSGSLSLIEISDDESIDERFDKILEFSSQNIRGHVESDTILENHVGDQEVSQQQQDIRRHLQFDATMDGKFDAAFNCYTSSRPGIAVQSLIEPKEIYKNRQAMICSSQTMVAQASFLGSTSVSSTKNGGNSGQVPSMILQVNNVAGSVSVGSDKLAGYQSEEKHIHGRSNNLLQINDPLMSTAREVGDHISSDHLVANDGNLASNMELSQRVSYFDQYTLPCEGKIPGQQFSHRVEELSQYQDSLKGKRQRETYTDEGVGCKLCNCKRSKCLKLYCECFAAGIYCVDSCACENCFNKPDYEDTVLDIRQQIESRNPLAFAPAIVKQANDSPNVVDDGNLMTPSSARHKRGCKCKKSKCLKKYCECYRANVGCSDGCRCEDCDNSFGKKSDTIFQRVEKPKNLSHQMLNTEDIMSDSIKSGTANQFSPTWHELVDITHATPFSHPHSRAVPSLTSHNMGSSANILHAQSQKGSGLQLSPGYLHWCSSALSPMQASGNKVSHELSSISALCDIMEDGSPDILMEENSNPTNMVKSGSPSQKRVSPPKPQPYKLSLDSTPGMRSSRKLIIQDMPSFPLLTPYYNSEDHMNQTENDHHGSSNDQ
ncbi:hypothetical protein PTKIN_Ptkin13bG0132100 [Pterospermum kingtungense]